MPHPSLVAGVALVVGVLASSGSAQTVTGTPVGENTVAGEADWVTVAREGS